MRFMLILALFGAGSMARAEWTALKPGTLCQRMTYENDREACEKIVATGCFDDWATGLCAELTFFSTQRNCLKTIKNKRYARSDLNDCYAMDFEAKKLECLAAHGEADNNCRD